MELVEKIFYKKVNNGDLLNIDRKVFEDQTGGGQTYFDLGGIDQEKLAEFLEYGIAIDKEESEKFENRKKYIIDVVKLGEENNVAKLEFDPRKDRKNYKISDQRKNRHPAWLASSGFPTIPNNARYASDIKNIPNLYIYIVKTTEKKYYAGFINNEIPISWEQGLGLERLLTWNKKDCNKGFIDFYDKKVGFNNDITNPFKLIKDEESVEIVENFEVDIEKDQELEMVLEDGKDYLTNLNDIEENELYELDTNNLEFEEHEIPFVTKKTKLTKQRKKSPRKINYDKKAKSNRIKGNLGEEAVVIMEQEKLIALGREDLAKTVEWISKTKGDGLGYDIESWEFIGTIFEKIFIEVKTTIGGIDTPFDISDTEVNSSKELGNRYYIYRIFGVEKINSKIKYYIVNGDVEDYFDLRPTSFKAYLKN